MHAWTESRVCVPLAGEAHPSLAVSLLLADASAPGGTLAYGNSVEHAGLHLPGWRCDSIPSEGCPVRRSSRRRAAPGSDAASEGARPLGAALHGSPAVSPHPPVTQPPRLSVCFCGSREVLSGAVRPWGPAAWNFVFMPAFEKPPYQ